MGTEKRIFIIDDEKDLLFILKEYFEAHGIEAVTYEAPPDLGVEVREKKPGAVLVDIFIPNSSGFDILNNIRKIDSNLPVIMMTGQPDDEKRLESLRNGAYALLAKPFRSFEEVYHIVNNAANHYGEIQRTVELTEEIRKRHEHERLNLLELDFLKKLQLMIGETEDSSFVIKNSFALLKNFLDFEVFAVRMVQGEDINIQIYPNVGQDARLMECVTATLVGKVPERSRAEKQTGATTGGDGEPAYSYMTVDMSSRDTVYGYAGLYRELPFNESEEAIFNRFCSNIALTLEKIRLFNEIKALSIHDGLTGIYNHAFIVRALEDEIERSKRYGSALSVALFDIDDFKSVNDTYGHLAGDAVLRRLAELMKSSLRTIDIVGRYGGEEFLAILPETDGANGYTVAERFRDTVEKEYFVYGGERIMMTISGGVGRYAYGMDVNKLIKVADDNLFRAKREGKNRIVL
ncbi:MAG: Diguanylate cyclase DosC [Syntrophorhabdus sp. PtaU1.Bin153]|nr:MAG: Diguanylate cyclase DosC [Syntrophorhabdus sp. PtaU1.Bin153]